MLESIDQDIEIIMDNQIEIIFSFHSYVHGFHVYKDVWSPLIDEKGLECFHENEKITYEFAIAVYGNDLSQRIIVGYVPISISKLFLQQQNSFLTYKVTEKLVNRKTGSSLEIPVSYTYTGNRKAIYWIKKKINEENKSIHEIKK